MITICGCSIFSELPPRPENVPQDAVRVGGSKGQWWIKCWREGDANKCHVFNAKGETIYNEEFRPYDGSTTVKDEHLKVDPRRSDVTSIYLDNGRILLPTTDFERHKKGIDDIRKVQSGR
jgi:hypothetical protein